MDTDCCTISLSYFSGHWFVFSTNLWNLLCFVFLLLPHEQWTVEVRLANHDISLQYRVDHTTYSFCILTLFKPHLPNQSYVPSQGPNPYIVSLSEDIELKMNNVVRIMDGIYPDMVEAVETEVRRTNDTFIVVSTLME